jgi:type II secretory pathway component PulJ
MIFKKMKKGQGLVPSTLIGWLIALAFLALLVVIAVMYKDQLSLLIDKIIGVFRFGG